MRLIDADALFDEVCEDLEEGEVLYSIPPSYIDDAPTVDAVEVVRCRDCRFYETAEYYPDGTKQLCRLLKRQMCEDAFCSFGERRTDEKV